ncbi:hypothetical protein, partial [Paraburkholderia azotifigens]
MVWRLSPICHVIGSSYKFAFGCCYGEKPWAGGLSVSLFAFLLFAFWFLLRWHPRFHIGTSRVAPVRGGTYFLCRRKESKQRKRANTAN